MTALNRRDLRDGKVANQHTSRSNGNRAVGSKYPVVDSLNRGIVEVCDIAFDHTKKGELEGYLKENVSSDATANSEEMRSDEDLRLPR